MEPIEPKADAYPSPPPVPFVESSRDSAGSLKARLVHSLKWGLRLPAWFLALLNLLALFGHFFRGQAIVLELLLYFPLVPLGIAAIVAGAAARPLGARREGSLIVQVGVAAILVGAWWMYGRGPDPDRPANQASEVVRLLHWNVLWGGIQTPGGGWGSLEEAMASKTPDIIVLSEAADNSMRKSLLARLGPGWHEIVREHQSSPIEHRNRLAVLSRWPVRIEAFPPIRNGLTCEAVVEHPDGAIRILVVDGKSRPTIPRSAMLHDIADICAVASKSQGSAIDVVVGDFNCVSRSRGFDEIRDAGTGYALASETALGWRATWPSWFPIYDIDHILVRREIRIRSCNLFSRFASDHRGQIAVLELPPKETEKP